MLTPKATEHVQCETAGAFIDAISPYGTYFRRVPPEKVWIFAATETTDTNSCLPPSERRGRMTCTSWHGPRISAKSRRRVILSNGSPKPRSSTISCAKRIVPASVCQKMPTPRDRRCSIQSIDSRATRPELGLAARILSMTNPPVGRHQKLCRLQHWHSITACRPDFWIGLGHRTSLPILQPSTQFALMARKAF